MGKLITMTSELKLLSLLWFFLNNVAFVVSGVLFLVGAFR